MDPFARTDIVIIGGGFGGLNAAMALDLRLKRGLKIDVTLSGTSSPGASRSGFKRASRRTSSAACAFTTGAS